jgi:hypothetical protein
MRRTLMFVQAGLIAAAAFACQACFDGYSSPPAYYGGGSPYYSAPAYYGGTQYVPYNAGRPVFKNYYGDSDDRHEWRNHEGDTSWSHHETPRQEHHEERQEHHETTEKGRS